MNFFLFLLWTPETNSRAQKTTRPTNGKKLLENKIGVSFLSFNGCYYKAKNCHDRIYQNKTHLPKSSKFCYNSWNKFKTRTANFFQTRTKLGRSQSHRTNLTKEGWQKLPMQETAQKLTSEVTNEQRRRKTNQNKTTGPVKLLHTFHKLPRSRCERGHGKGPERRQRRARAPVTLPPTGAERVWWHREPSSP